MNEYTQYFDTVPYEIRRTSLYSPLELFDTFDRRDNGSFDRCFDTRVYRHVCDTGKMTREPMEMAARAVHDCEMRKYMHEFLDGYEPRQVVGIMGGHGMRRDDGQYRLAVNVSKTLTERGHLMVSGGGPGAMEATHLGAWMAGRTTEEVEQAIAIVSQAPTFRDAGWLSTAFEVREKFPLKGRNESLAIPTWFYGHEPPCAFATHIAKFFDNSIREDQILTVAYGGLIYMPGSAGTVQEVFQEACQDHYLTLGYASPMVFVDRDFWTHEVPVYPFMEHMMAKRYYKNLLLSLVDTEEEILSVFDR